MKFSLVTKIVVDLDNKKSMSVIKKAFDDIQTVAKVIDLEAVKGTNVYKETEEE